MATDFNYKPSATPPQSSGATDFNYQAGATPPVPPQQGVLPKPQSFGEQAGNFMQKAGDVVNNIFPGKQIGQAIGTLGGYLLSPNKSTYDTSAPSPLQVAGDVAQGALTVAAPNVGNGGTVLGRIGANATLGAGLSGTNAIAQGQGAKDVLKSTALGAGIGAGTSAVGEGVGKLVQKLPDWLTRKALPKLKSGNVDYALENTKLGTVKSMLDNSQQATRSYESQIQGILDHPQYGQETGSTNYIQDILASHPNADLKQDKVVNILKQVAPQNKSLIDKVVDGTASLLEKNTLRKELDVATAKAYTDKPTLTFAKDIGKSFADLLRKDVQTTAPETAPIFANYSKEIDLRKALTAAQKKIDNKGAVGLFDILAAIGGGAGGGLPGAAVAVGAEKALRSPAVDLGAAKAVQALGKTAPVMNAIGSAIKPPLIKSLTNGQEAQQTPQTGPINMGLNLPNVNSPEAHANRVSLVNSATGVGSIESGALKALANPEDISIIEQGISHLRSPKSAEFSISDARWTDVERLAKKLKISLDQPFAKIANKLENALAKVKKLKR